MDRFRNGLFVGDRGADQYVLWALAAGVADVPPIPQRQPAETADQTLDSRNRQPAARTKPIVLQAIQRRPAPRARPRQRDAQNLAGNRSSDSCDIHTR